jgi:hypothetical protein
VVERLHLLPSGPTPPNPSELLNSRRFAAFLDHVSQQYDRVVLDAPPVLGMADALILGARCDSTLLVVRADYSDGRATEAAYQSLLRIGVRSIATVLNGVRRRNSYSRYAQDYYRVGQKWRAESAPPKTAGPAMAPVEVAEGELQVAGDYQSTSGNGNGRTVNGRPSASSCGIETATPMPNLAVSGRGPNGVAVASGTTDVSAHRTFVQVAWDKEVPPPPHGGSNGASFPFHPGR